MEVYLFIWSYCQDMKKSSLNVGTLNWGFTVFCVGLRPPLPSGFAINEHKCLLTLFNSCCNRCTHASSTCDTLSSAWRRHATSTQCCWCSVTTTMTRKSTSWCKVWTSARWCRSSTLTQYRRIQRSSLASLLGTVLAILRRSSKCWRHSIILIYI